MSALPVLSQQAGRTPEGIAEPRTAMPRTRVGHDGPCHLEAALNDFGLGKESINGLGPGAYLVNVLPSTVLVAGAFAILSSRIYPWSSPIRGVRPGVESVVATVRESPVTALVIFASSVLFVTVVLRPFQISAVQWLEGYWRDRSILRIAHEFAVERHQRRRGLNLVRLQAIPEEEPRLPRFDVVAAQQRARVRHRRRQEAAMEVISQQYPDQAEDVMPTLLGNVLRRAETGAGERYGLSTVHTFPRLYPYLSPRLAQENETQLNVLDASATLAIVIGALAALSSPFLIRFDAWSAVPVALLLVAGVSYRGARIAAQRHGVVLAAAFDLHRFDMLSAMHRRLPRDAREELAENAALTSVLEGEPAIRQRPWKYAHPAPSEGPGTAR
ncbi:hypothetical protein [Actinoplanes sp. NPDC048796]|uniref:hypothetical protein n=1 Tax=Actinoplanes sp. NPDC048796 TaxID=3155640 RepID=UPI0033E1E655